MYLEPMWTSYAGVWMLLAEAWTWLSSWKLDYGPVYTGTQFPGELPPEYFPA